MEIFKHWELIKHLTMREIKGRYKQSFLGLFWIILNPFFQMVILSFVFSHIIRFGDYGVPYPLFIYVGLLSWTFFGSVITSSMSVLVENSSLINKIYFPREILLISSLLAKTFDFFIASFVFLFLMIWYQQSFDWHMLLFFVVFLVQLAFMYGFSLLLSIMNLLYRDVQYLFSLVMMLWFYLTPIMYSVELFPEQFRWIFKINPMSVFINAYREVLLAHGMPNWGSLAIGVGMSLILYIIAISLFKKMEKIFSDIV